MKSLLIKNLFLIIILSVTLYSCISNNNDTSVSDDATITKFYINSNDSSPDANDAVFTINNTTRVIENTDSLPYKTRIDSLIPSVYFTSSSGFIINDTLTYGSYSSIEALDFTKPIKITNVASDGTTKLDYTIKLNVHKVDPYLYVWTKFTDKIINTAYENQKAIYYKDKCYFFTGSGVTNFVSNSTDAKTWETTQITTLPSNVEFQNIDTLKNEICLLSGDKVYSSTTGNNWTEKSTNSVYTYKVLLCNYNNKLYAVAQNKSTSTYSIIYSADGVTWNESTPLPNNFPVSGFAASTFKPKYGSQKMIVVGGYNTNGVKLNTRWTTEDGNYWVNLQGSKSPFDATSYGAITYYGSRLLLIGGTKTAGDESLLDPAKQIRNSLDEGLTWNRADTTQIYPPTEFKFRKNASVVINPKNHDMYIIGGSSNLNVLSDVWKVKVNYYNFKESEWSKY